MKQVDVYLELLKSAAIDPRLMGALVGGGGGALIGAASAEPGLRTRGALVGGGLGAVLGSGVGALSRPLQREPGVEVALQALRQMEQQTALRDQIIEQMRQHIEVLKKAPGA